MSGQTRTSRKAIASLTLAILTLILALVAGASRALPFLILCVLLCLGSVMLGIWARKDVRKQLGQLEGLRLAGWGIGTALAGPVVGLALATFG